MIIMMIIKMRIIRIILLKKMFHQRMMDPQKGFFSKESFKKGFTKSIRWLVTVKTSLKRWQLQEPAAEGWYPRLGWYDRFGEI